MANGVVLSLALYVFLLGVERLRRMIEMCFVTT
jgi:hypothetical protein